MKNLCTNNIKTETYNGQVDETDVKKYIYVSPVTLIATIYLITDLNHVDSAPLGITL